MNPLVSVAVRRLWTGVDVTLEWANSAGFDLLWKWIPHSHWETKVRVKLSNIIHIAVICTFIQYMTLFLLLHVIRLLLVSTLDISLVDGS